MVLHRRVILTLLLTTSHAQTPLPPATSEAKVFFDQIVTLEGGPHGGRVLVRDRGGKTLRIVEAGAGLESLRRAEVRDFTLTRDGLLAIAFHAVLPMGNSARYLGLYPLTGAPRLLPLNDVVCQRLAADDLTGVWCLGRGSEGGLAHRVAGERAGRWTLAAPKGLLLEGLPQFFSAEPGVLQAWIPAATIIRWDTITGDARLQTISLPAEHALFSLAVDQNGKFLALLPIRRVGEADRLDTPYGLLPFNPIRNGAAFRIRQPGRAAPRSPAPTPSGTVSSAVSTGCREFIASERRTPETKCPILPIWRTN